MMELINDLPMASTSPIFESNDQESDDMLTILLGIIVHKLIGLKIQRPKSSI